MSELLGLQVDDLRKENATCRVFGTQGHDLAIPTSWGYLRHPPDAQACISSNFSLLSCARVVTGMKRVVGGKVTGLISLVRPKIGCEPFDARDGHRSIVEFHRGAPRLVNLTARRINLITMRQAYRQRLRPPAKRNETVNATVVWSNKDNLEEAEAVCMRRHTAGNPSTMVRCGTTARYNVKAHRRARMIAKQQARISNRFNTSAGSATSADTTGVRERPNIVLLLLDAVSRQQLRRALPNTVTAIVDPTGPDGAREWSEFTAYALAGPNSGPNQFALYTGHKQQGRNLTNRANSRQMLWERLREAGYITLKIENDCILNSNMMQSLMPKVDHGPELTELMCKFQSHPHCVGGRSAAQHTLQFASLFLGMKEYDDVPKAAFVHLTDGHEDSMTMIRSVDATIAGFIKQQTRTAQNTMVRDTMLVVLSDHGLHYGSYFSTPTGQLEHQSPLLFIRPPRSLPAMQRAHFLANAGGAATPYDLHETILDAAGIVREGGARLLGRSLFQSMKGASRGCADVGIPDEFCPGHFSNAVVSAGGCARSCVPATMLPSLDSYYAQLPNIGQTVRALSVAAHGLSPNGRPNQPRHHKGRLIHVSNQGRLHSSALATSLRCRCFTSYGLKVSDAGRNFKWRTCAHKWNQLDPANSFVVVACPATASSDRLGGAFDVVMKFVDTARSRRLAAVPELVPPPPNDGPAFPKRQPNILILELDSVSMPLMARRLPKLKALFEGKASSVCPMTPIHAPGELLGKTHIAGLFTRHNVVGANSLPNQLALLSGCVPSHLIAHAEHRAQALKDGWVEVEEHVGPNTTAAPCQGRHGNTKNVTRVTGHSMLCPPGVAAPFKAPHSGGRLLAPSAWLFDLARDAGYTTSFAEDVCYHFHNRCSRRFSSQDMFYDTDNGFDQSRFSSMFCGLERARPGLNDDMDSWDLRTEYMVEYIKGFMGSDLHQRRPKFQLANIAGLGHDYRHLPFRHSGLQRADTVITGMLCDLLSAPETANTVVVLYGDHGTQDGPVALEWHGQAEQRNPVLGVLSPPDFADAEALRANLGRLVTPYDVYRTVVGLLKPREFVLPRAHPVWGFDLLNAEVPRHRTCQEALIPPDFCQCMHEYVGVPGMQTAGTDYSAKVQKALRAAAEPPWSPRPHCSPHEPKLHGPCSIDDDVRKDGCCFGASPPRLPSMS